MEFNNAVFGEDRKKLTQKDAPKARPGANDVNLTEDDLRRGSGSKKPVMEGQPAGGHNFGKSNNTSAANDKNNPSQYAGNSNAYFDRAEPSEEHPENTNFKDPMQDRSPDYGKAQPRFTMNNAAPEAEKAERGNEENDRQHKGDTSSREEQQGNGQPNIPGPGELPAQQKVGEKVEDDDREHIET